MTNLIHFAHGNGFPSRCYQQFLSAFEPHYQYCYIDKIGHNPLYPVTENWDYLVDELLESVRSQTSQPVIAVGHSLGGVLSFLAAVKEPALFKSVIMLDSPLLGKLKSNLVRIAKTLGFIDRVTPAYQTKNRRLHWDNREELLQYLKSRPLFKNFDKQCLMDYIDYGLIKKSNGYHLRFNREIEYAIYCTIPHVLPLLKGKLQTPAALIYGDRSWVVTAVDRHYMEKEFGIPSFKIEGTHLFPFEHPKAAANKVIEVIDRIRSC